MIVSASPPDLIARWCRPYRDGGLIGRPYGEDGCLRLAQQLFREAGYPLPDEVAQAARGFRRLAPGERPQFLDVAYFRGALFGRRHLAVMLDARWMLHTGRPPLLQGVTRSELSRSPWATMLHGVYRRLDCAC
jgi:hypothetical protein